MTLLERVGLALTPIGEYLGPFLSFDVLVSLVLAILVAGVIFQNRKKNQSVTFEMENLIRRYIIFRGHRQALIKVHQKDEAIKHEILRAISNSWNHFKGTLENYSITLRDADRRARNLLLILGLLMVLNSLRSIVLGVQDGQLHWVGLVLKELPIYFFLLTGFLLISIQSYRPGKQPLASFQAELDAIISDTEEFQEALDNEFDPIDQSFPTEESWPEQS